MCESYSKADPILYESRTRSIRMRGVLTTIRLENLFWEVLTEMAARESITTNQLVAKLHDEVVAWRGESVNFASFLRVCCLRYLSAVAQKELDSQPKRAARVAAATGLRSVG
jgi:predicted DNA-binding ribbon-helix-helix protein